jgi:hypothetical protein
MKFHEILSVVPKPVSKGAYVLVGCAVVIGPITGFIEATRGSGPGVHGAYLPILESIAGLGAGLLVGALIAAWVLGLGYVYGDARRRTMPPTLWTLIAALVPNLLGFLLYLVLRRPIASPCLQCGQPITAEQRFCPWCGYRGASTPASETSSLSV